jgi:hypothetical protein
LQLQRERRDHQLLRVHPGLAAEAATDVRRDDPHLLGCELQRAAQQTLQHVRHLRGAVHHQSTFVVDAGRGGMRLHRGHRDAVVDVTAAHHDVGVAEDVGLHHVGGGHRDVVAVLGEQYGSAVGQGVLRVDHHVEQVEVAHHRRCRVAGVQRRVGHHHGDGLADESHGVDREGRPGEVVVHLRHAVERPQGQVGGGVHADDAGHRAGLVGVDAEQAAVRHLRAHEHRVHGTVEPEVVDVPRRTEQQFRVFRAQHACSEDGSGHPPNLPRPERPFARQNCCQ